MMSKIWLYSFLSIFIISLASLVGIFFISIKEKRLNRILLYLVGFSAGALLGDVFLHLLPELFLGGFLLRYSFFALFGIILFFFLEKFVSWKYCRMSGSKQVCSFAYMNLVGDALHNFVDGLVVAGSYLISIPVGLATSVAVLFHEIPQEIGDFGILVHGGFKKSKALFFNFMVSLFSFLGVIFALVLSRFVENVEGYLIALTIGGFLYVAGSDLIPELHKESGFAVSFLQIISLLLGMGIMAILLVFFG